ncbi:histidine kinase [Lysinibacillus sp. 2017]|uniref:histidine kinase n=1 Tax=unclassified Lysinibacillus TaxID=2636778 RepID=UPI000D5264B0|nr:MULTISPECIES: histidine kinase [unclassified Lysinibacillus]AWE07478.1 histidine kinase [Lysinibacillus sp. 2017]TGN36641.1 histidine kinase [Lysinibacillus sp. S2017]
MRRYLSLISLVLLVMFIVLGFIFPQVLNPLPDSWDIVLIIILLLGSFFTALFSMKGPLKVITLVASSVGILGLGVVIIFSIAMMIFGNFGS